MQISQVMIAAAAALFSAGCNTTTFYEPEKERTMEYIWSEPVRFLEYHDPMVFWLSDESKLEVVLDRDDTAGAKWSEVSEWKRGRELRLAFSAATGPILIDVETFKRIPITGGLDSRHPLDLILKRNLENSADTISIAEAYSSNSRHWEREIDRLYDCAAGDERVRDAVRAAQMCWKEFSQVHFKAAGAINSLPTGTIWTVRHAEYVHGLRRSHALSLMSLMDAVTNSEQAIAPEDPAVECSSASPPNLNDYACGRGFKGKPAPVNLSSHPRARTFRTQLLEQSAKPADFACYYVAANWGCGSPCQQWALIDLRDGKVYFAPFSTALGGRHSVTSRLFIADAPEDIAEFYDSEEKAGVELTPSAERIFSPDYTTYWEWRESEKKFVQISYRR